MNKYNILMRKIIQSSSISALLFAVQGLRVDLSKENYLTPVKTLECKGNG
jgi:hypothetical protein